MQFVNRFWLCDMLVFLLSIFLKILIIYLSNLEMFQRNLCLYSSKITKADFFGTCEESNAFIQNICHYRVEFLYDKKEIRRITDDG